MGSCARGIPRGSAAVGSYRLRQRRVTRYYAAFHAASALFALEGRTFTKHSALEAAVHRDLVKAERWSADLGRDYSFCVNVRGVGDYGDEVRVDARQAEETTAAARRILEVVSEAMPNDFLASRTREVPRGRRLASCLYLQRQLNEPVPLVAFDL